jgi:hypothetical protein
MPLASIIAPCFLKKTSFRASKWPQKLKTAKNSKLPKLPENYFEPVGKGGWPPISTWIKLPIFIHIGILYCIFTSTNPMIIGNSSEEDGDKSLFLKIW